MDRAEHLQCCKDRALEYLDRGELADAVASMCSDMGKHPETGVNPALIQLAMLEIINHNTDGVRRFIEGFN